MKLIPLTKGLFTQVDDDRFAELNQHKWYASGKPGQEYAARRMKEHEQYPRRFITMHQWLCKTLENGLIPDHVDGDRLNNQMYNLLVGTQAQNLQNSKTAINQKGISRDNTHDTYKAYINISLPRGTKRVNVGTYSTFDQAVQARANKIKELGL